MNITRRQLITAGSAAAGSLLLPDMALAAPKPSFSFVHIPDMHIQPELGATAGVHKAFETVRNLTDKPAFGLVGGDLVMDASLVSHDRANRVYALWRQAAEDLKFPLHYAVGNHDLFGLDVNGKPEQMTPITARAFGRSRRICTRKEAGEQTKWSPVPLC